MYTKPTHIVHRAYQVALSFAQYIYGIYLGLNSKRIDPPVKCTCLIIVHFVALPFLVRTELLLAPLLPLFTGYIISLLGFNVAKHVLPLYFGS